MFSTFIVLGKDNSIVIRDFFSLNSKGFIPFKVEIINPLGGYTKYTKRTLRILFRGEKGIGE